MNTQEALEKFLTQLEADGRSPHTIKQYGRHIRLFAHWAADVGLCGDVSGVSHETIAKFLNTPVAKTRPDGGVKKATSMNGLRTSLRCFFHYLHQAGIIPENPSRLVRHAQCGRPVPRTLSKTEIDRLLDQMLQDTSLEARRDHALFHLMVTTGLRIGSTLGLNVQDVDLVQAEIWLRKAKGDRQERVILNDKIRQHLADFIGDRKSGPMFLSRQNRRISSRHVQRRFEMWILKAGISRKTSPHDLRHFFAQDLYNRTHDLPLVKDALRHRSIVSTLIYARVNENRLRKALLS